jgi:tetratricopeptide (TPR) repeat protein
MQNRQDWQNNRGDRWDNWHDAWHDRWGDWHGGWHHGWCGAGYWGNWWGNMWNQYPIWSAFGITNWALNSASWLFGLGSYSNPYYVESSGGYDYSQPIVYEQAAYQQPQTTSAGETLPPGVTTKGLALFEEARGLFQNKKYQEALSKDNEAIKEMPQDAALHEFRALCQFALGDYKGAAATLYAVLAVGPGWDWTTMYNLYSDIDEYTAHLRKLEDYCKEHKDSADAYFVLAYQYLTMDKKDLAIRMYQIVARLAPNDTVTKQMLQALDAKPLDDNAPAPKESANAPSIPAEKLVGDWKAMGPNNSEFKMKLTKEGEFNWGYTVNGKTQSIKGAYGQQGGNLVMETDGNNTMVADVKLADDATLEFQMTGVSSSPKLLFKK